MLIAQITDLHLGFDPGRHDANRARLDGVLRKLIEGPNRPDLLLVTGDLTEHGDVESYRACADALRALPFPAYPALGNHDDRAAFAQAFGNVPMPHGFVHYALSIAGLRLIVLDTLEPGRQGGGFCAARAAWLDARLREDRDTPTVIVMHHPPLAAGIDWMDPDPGAPWITRFAAAIRGHDQVRSILCGHLHRAIVAPWRGITVTVCPSIAPPLALDLSAIDPAQPDGRAMVLRAAPGYALHRWHDGELVTLLDTADEAPVIARFDARMQPEVRRIVAERAD